MSTTIPTYRYQYRPSSSHLPTSNFSLSPPRNTLPHHYLESPTNIFLQSSTNPQQPEKIIIRQVGGPGDNHVQWVCTSDIVPYQPDSEEFPLAGARERISGNCGGGGGGGGKRGIKSLKSFESHIHGVVHTASWHNNDVGDRLWLRSDQPIIKGRRSVPVVNLDKGVVSGEVCISHVTWHPHKRDLSNINTTITFIGAEYRHGQGPRRGGPFRMCIAQDPSSSSSSSSSHDEDGIIEMIFLEELEACFEDVKPPSPVHNHSHSHSHPHALSPPPMELRILGLGDSNHISRQLRGPRGTAIFDEADSRTMDDDDDDDNLSQTSFASSTKGKLTMDLVARSLSIFNFNAAMLDLAALSNQSMDGFVRDIDEQPEAEDDSDEEEDEEGEQRVWSDCESIQSTER